jgi:hypothetical protein
MGYLGRRTAPVLAHRDVYAENKHRDRRVGDHIENNNRCGREVLEQHPRDGGGITHVVDLAPPGRRS